MASSTDDRNKPVTGYPAAGAAQHIGAPYNPNAYPQPTPTQPPNNYYYPGTATAYPYNAPPPPQQQPPPYYTNYNGYQHQPPPPPPYYPSRNTTFLRRLIIAGIAALVIVGAITFIVWLVLRPKLPEVTVASAALSSFSANGSQVSGNWDVGLIFRNPNKKIKVYYDEIDALVYYQSVYLAETALPPMYIGKRNETRVTAGLSARAVYVADRAVGPLLDDRRRGAVSFNLRMLAWVRFKAGAWRTRRRLMRVFCDGVKVGVSSNGAGALVGGPRDCEVSV